MVSAMKMVERVARALAIANGKDPDAPAWITYPSGETSGTCWRDQYAEKATDAIAAMREPTESMEDAARGAWLWYAGLPHDNKWTLGQQNKAGGYKLSLTDEEAAAVHLPKHVMGRICWRTQIDAALRESP